MHEDLPGGVVTINIDATIQKLTISAIVANKTIKSVLAVLLRFGAVLALMKPSSISSLDIVSESIFLKLILNIVRGLSKEL